MDEYAISKMSFHKLCRWVRDAHPEDVADVLCDLSEKILYLKSIMNEEREEV
jgi:hypothetical protein